MDASGQTSGARPMKIMKTRRVLASKASFTKMIIIDSATTRGNVVDGGCYNGQPTQNLYATKPIARLTLFHTIYTLLVPLKFCRNKSLAHRGQRQIDVNPRCPRSRIALSELYHNLYQRTFEANHVMEGLHRHMPGHLYYFIIFHSN